MTRRVALLVFILACGCRSEMQASNGLDETVSGWQRSALFDLAASNLPDPIPAKAVRHAWRASYEGPGTLDVRVYQLTAPEFGLDFAQRLRAPANTAYFFMDHVYFVAIEWRNADRQATQDFVRELERRLNNR